jgi:hypothetical protein
VGPVGKVLKTSELNTLSSPGRGVYSRLCRHSKIVRGRPERAGRYPREEVVIVTNIVTDAVVVGYPSVAPVRIATPTLEVRERAVTLRSARGQVCPLAGWPIASARTTSGQRISLRAAVSGASSTDTGTTFIGMGNDRSFKHSPGSNAINGTG